MKDLEHIIRFKQINQRSQVFYTQWVNQVTGSAIVDLY